MKFLHLADLHLGKRIGDYDLSDVQEDILSKLIDYIVENNIDTIVIAGDIYDTRDPSAKATSLLDNFLSKAHKNNINILMISGNHDQEDKLHFASNILKDNNIYIVTNIKDSLKPVTIDSVNFYLLPFINKYDVKSYFGDEASNIDSVADAISFVINKMNINKDEKNVIVSHQAVLGSKCKTCTSGSEVSVEKDKDGMIGGEDIVPSSVYKDFDYVALGHIHKALNIESNMRYPGALLKYHKDEANNKKSFTIVDTDDFSIKEIEIKPKRDVVLLKGKFEELRKQKEYSNDYVFFELTDKDYISEPMAKLKLDFPFAAGLSYFRNETDTIKVEQTEYEDIDKLSKFDLFNDFYKMQLGEEMNDEQKKIVNSIIKEIWGN